MKVSDEDIDELMITIFGLGNRAETRREDLLNATRQWLSEIEAERNRRIIACVDACEGMPIEWLESKANLAKDLPLTAIAKINNELIQQRDELLADLNIALGTLADIGNADDMTLLLARNKSQRVYKELQQSVAKIERGV